ncbi:MAG: tetratricopeptide repeat protein [Elusimicrobiota bacterium]|jgi:tetratricopeptide (TPR) repeat protein|nr:tetratricopeptide repeat protein [Elusimicrobiota bacterium]
MKKNKDIFEFSCKNLKVSIAITAIYIILAAAAYHVNNSNMTYEKFIKKAYKNYDLGNYNDAIRYFDRLVNFDEKDLDIGIVKNYAHSLLKVENFSAAQKYYSLAAEMDDSDDKNYYYIAISLYEEGDTSGKKSLFLEAVNHLQKAIQLNPNDENYYLLIGSCFRKAGDLENARNIYRRAIFTGKFNMSGFYHLIGNTFMEEERYRSALHNYEKAQENGETFAGNYLSIGEVYLKLENEEEALANYKKAIAVDKTYLPAYLNIATFYYDKKDFVQSKDWAAKAVEVSSLSEKANFILAMSYKHIGKESLYKEYIQKAAFLGSNEAAEEMLENKMKFIPY